MVSSILEVLQLPVLVLFLGRNGILNSIPVAGIKNEKNKNKTKQAKNRTNIKAKNTTSKLWEEF